MLNLNVGRKEIWPSLKPLSAVERFNSNASSSEAKRDLLLVNEGTDDDGEVEMMDIAVVLSMVVSRVFKSPTKKQ